MTSTTLDVEFEADARVSLGTAPDGMLPSWYKREISGDQVVFVIFFLFRFIIQSGFAYRFRPNSQRFLT